jgi:cytochrome c oxidase subunit 2
MSDIHQTPSVDSMAFQEPLHVDRYEAIWVRISAFVIIAFLLAIIYASTVGGIHVPGVAGRVDPNTVATPGSGPFANPEVKEIAPGKYEAYIRSQFWAFTPNEIRIPMESEITFFVTSQDIQHGFLIEKTNINMMVLPGQISRLKTRFDTPGVYNFVCHEYCGVGHHTMFGRIIVEDPNAVVEATPAAAEVKIKAGNAEKGQQLYAVCSACHGPNGEGVQNLGKPFTTSEFLKGLDDAELVEFLKKGRAVDDPLNTTGVAMPPRGGNPALTDQDLMDIVAFVRTLQK